MDRLAGTINRPVGVQVADGFTSPEFRVHAKVPGADAPVPRVVGDPKVLVSGLATDGKERIPKIVDACDRSGKDAIRVGAASLAQLARPTVQRNRQAGNRFPTGQVGGPDHRLAARLFQGQVESRLGEHVARGLVRSLRLCFGRRKLQIVQPRGQWLAPVAQQLEPDQTALVLWPLDLP